MYMYLYMYMYSVVETIHCHHLWAGGTLLHFHLNTLIHLEESPVPSETALEKKKSKSSR